MKQTLCLFLLLLTLTGCGSTVAITPTPTAFPTPSSTFVASTSTAIASPTETVTLLPSPPTLEPEQAKDRIRTLLREPMECEVPCLWGIIPGKTTLSEALSVFVYLGLPIKSIAQGSTEFYGTKYDFDNGLSLLVTLTIRADVVSDLVLEITPEAWETGIPREWLAYSPETLMYQYGVPSKVDFFVGRGPRSTYSMNIYFDAEDFIIEYISNTNLGPNWQICPLNNQVDYVAVWMGASPQHPPLAAIPLEQATSLTLEEFAQLMTEDPSDACFNLRDEAFP